MTTDALLPPACARRAIDDEALDQLFRAARTHNGWLDRPVPEALLRQAFDLAKMGPTSINHLNRPKAAAEAVRAIRGAGGRAQAFQPLTTALWFQQRESTSWVHRHDQY